MPTHPLIIGVDPGGHWTGIVVRQGPRFVAGATITRAGDQALEEYLAEVLDTVATYVRLGPGIAGDTNHRVACIAIEDVTPPVGAMGIIDPTGLIEAAKVLGYVLSLTGVIIVDSGGNGSQPLKLYPPELVGERERVGAGKLRHVRSAWDVAGRAELELRAHAR